MENLMAKRLQQALGRQLLKSKAGLAKACGVTMPSVTSWFNGKTKNLRGYNLYAAARYLEVSPEWLATGRGQMLAEDEPSPYLSGDKITLTQVSGKIRNDAEGNFYWEEQHPYTDHVFSRLWMQQHNFDVDRCRITEAIDNSNADWITAGDMVIIQLADTDIRNSDDPKDNIFALNYNRHCKIRRVIRQHNGSMVLRALNPDKASYPDEPISKEDTSEVPIVGRVLWRCG
jgi:phage repressor protein C with HTH and peptisase S24 domain